MLDMSPGRTLTLYGHHLTVLYQWQPGVWICGQADQLDKRPRFIAAYDVKAAEFGLYRLPEGFDFNTIDPTLSQTIDELAALERLLGS